MCLLVRLSLLAKNLCVGQRSAANTGHCGSLGLALSWFPFLSGLWWPGSCSGTWPNLPVLCRPRFNSWPDQTKVNHKLAQCLIPNITSYVPRNKITVDLNACPSWLKKPAKSCWIIFVTFVDTVHSWTMVYKETKWDILVLLAKSFNHVCQMLTSNDHKKLFRMLACLVLKFLANLASKSTSVILLVYNPVFTRTEAMLTSYLICVS